MSQRYILVFAMLLGIAACTNKEVKQTSKIDSSSGSAPREAYGIKQGFERPLQHIRASALIH